MDFSEVSMFSFLWLQVQAVFITNMQKNVRVVLKEGGQIPDTCQLTESALFVMELDEGSDGWHSNNAWSQDEGDKAAGTRRLVGLRDAYQRVVECCVCWTSVLAGRNTPWERDRSSVCTDMETSIRRY